MMSTLNRCGPAWESAFHDSTLGSAGSAGVPLNVGDVAVPARSLAAVCPLGNPGHEIFRRTRPLAQIEQSC